MAMKLPKLYKMKKKMLVWEIETFHSPECSEYQVTHGQEGGKLQSTRTQVTAGKNIGKANATSIEEQCDLEAKSLWQRQIDRKGYDLVKFNPNVTFETPPPAAMLAHEYEKHKDKVTFPCFVQPKLDGVRCLAYFKDNKVKLVSRQRKEFNHLDHIKKSLEILFKTYPNVIFDGELYSHKYTFQEIISAIKRDEPNDLTKDVEYHIYDLVSDQTYRDRYEDLADIVVNNFEDLENNHPLRHVITEWVKTEEEIEKYHAKWTKCGYEGLMIRTQEGLYKQDGRSQDLLKYKKFMDQEFPIIGADQNKGKLSNTCTFKCECNGTTFDVMPKGTQEERAQLYTDWKNGTIKKGDLATVEFFSWSTSTPKVPRFPIMKGVRSYE